MRSKIIWTVVVTTAMFLTVPMGHGQNIGFRVGIAPSPPPMAVMQTVQPVHNFQQFGTFQQFGVSPISASGLVNTITPPVVTNFLGATHFHLGFAPSPTPAVIVRPGTIVPNGGFIVGAPGPTVYAPGAVIVTPNVNVYAPTYVVAPTPQPRLRHHERGLPAPGTPRAHVISQWGTPVVSILTRNGETLQYGGGVVIILQNGLVAPR